MKSLMVLFAYVFSCLFAVQIHAVEFSLQTSGKTEVGILRVLNDETNIYAEFLLDDNLILEGWHLAELHMHAGASLEDFPLTKKGNPKVGHFAFKYEGLSDGESFVIPVSDFGDAESILIAAHAVLERISDDGISVETAWAEGVRFTSKGNWATWLVYDIAVGPEPEPCDTLVVDLTISGVEYGFEFTICEGEITSASGAEFLSYSFDPVSSILDFMFIDPLLGFFEVSLFLAPDGSVEILDSSVPFSGPFSVPSITGTWFQI